MQRVSDAERVYFERAADAIRRAPQNYYIIDTELRPDGLSIVRYAPYGGGVWIEVPVGWV